MKWMIASDIHGSAFYCEKMLKAFEREQADKLLLLGDILYHGPRNDLPKGYAPKKVIELLNNIKEKILCVRGNCDAEVDQMVLEFPIMADYAMIAEGDLNIFVTHGHHFNEKKLPPMFEKTQEGLILLHGHTHVPVCRVHESYTYMNPGSVSIPKENSEHSYMILENGAFWWKTLDGETYLNFKGSKPERGYIRCEMTPASHSKNAGAFLNLEILIQNRRCAMKRTDQYLYLANGRLHRSLFGAINEKGEVKIVKDNQVLTRMNEKQAKALGNIARKIKELDNQKSISAVYLYGSVARGSAHGMSDLDIFIVLNDNDLTPEECRKFRIENSSFNDIDIDIHFENRNIFLKSNSTYHTNIKKEGLELWTA